MVILAFRFNGQDFLISGLTMPKLGAGQFSIDINNYIKYTEFFRSDHPFWKINVDAPYLYRPVSPWLASWLPFQPITSLNIVNVVFLALSMILLYRLSLERLARGQSILVLLLFIFSFPFFYYGSVGNIDPGSVFFILLGVSVYLSYGIGASILLLPLALFQKEVTILYLFFIGGLWLREFGVKNGIRAASLILIGLVFYLLLKSNFPSGDYIWQPGSDFISDNIARPRAYISVLLSLGIPGAIILLLIKYWKWKLDSSFLLFSLGLIALICYAFVSAYVDGRFVFVGFPFLSLYSVILLDRRYSESD